MTLFFKSIFFIHRSGFGQQSSATHHFHCFNSFSLSSHICPSYCLSITVPASASSSSVSQISSLRSPSCCSIHSSLQSIVFRIRSVSWDVGTLYGDTLESRMSYIRKRAENCLTVSDQQTVGHNWCPIKKLNITFPVHHLSHNAPP